MGDGTPYILPIKPLVEFYGGGEFFHKFISGLGKAATPQLILGHAYLLHSNSGVKAEG
jgi:hypothetical protein